MSLFGRTKFRYRDGTGEFAPKVSGGKVRIEYGGKKPFVYELDGTRRPPGHPANPRGESGDFQNCRRNRRSFAQKRRMSSMACLSMSIRCGPMPKAKPVTLSGSYPPFFNTVG